MFQREVTAGSLPAAQVQTPSPRPKLTFGLIVAVLFGAVLLQGWYGALEAQAATITSSVTGNWNAGATWVGGVVPAATDTVVIAAGDNVSTNGSRTCAGITIAGTLTLANTNVLTVNGGVSGAGAITGPATGGSNCTFSITGDWTYTGTFSAVNRISLTATGAVDQTISSTATATFRIFTINKSSGTIFLSKTPTVGNTFTMTAGNVSYNGAAQSILDATYPGNLTVAGSGNKTPAGNLTINGNLDVGSGTTLTIGISDITVTGTTTVSGTLAHSSATGNETYTGNVTITSGGTWSETANEAIIFGGNLQNDGTFTGSTGRHTFSGAAKTIGGANPLSIARVRITGTYQNNGTLTVGTILDGVGALTNGATGTLNIGGTIGTCSVTTLANAGIINHTGTGATTTALANYTNTGTINISGSGTITGITNNAAGIVNHSGSSTISSFNNATSTSTLNISTLTVPTISTLTVSAAGNTVNYTGAGAQTVIALAYSNLVFSGSGAKTMPAGTSATGNLSIAPTGTATASVAAGQNLAVGSLTLGGLSRINGTWGSTSSAATHKNNTYFAATTGYMTIGTDTRTTPTINWNNPSGITYNAALSAAQLNATAVPAGSFVYTPASGTVLNAGNGQTLHTDFTPTDTTSYLTASKDVTIDVAQAILTVTGITADNKPYDGNTDATLNAGGAALVGNLDGGNVVLSTAGATGAFLDSAVGTGKTVQVSGLSISGSASGNYTLIQPTTTADITADPPTGITLSAMKTVGPTVTWTGVALADGYNIYRSLYGTGVWEKINGSLVSGSPYVSAGSLSNTEYSWTVTAVFGVSESANPAGVAGRTALLEGWNTVSCPLDRAADLPANVYGPWVDNISVWVSTNNLDPDNSGYYVEPTSLVSGTGQFVNAWDDSTVLDTTGTENTLPVTVTLLPGWNLISNPTLTNMSGIGANWSVGAVSLSTAITSNTVGGALYWWNGTWYDSWSIDDLSPALRPTVEPWKGYWILNMTNAGQTLTIKNTP